MITAAGWKVMILFLFINCKAIALFWHKDVYLQSKQSDLLVIKNTVYTSM
jgi:hypothetical protein